MRVMIADDSPGVRAALRLLLQDSFDVVADVTRPQDLVNAVGAFCPDILLLDWELDGVWTSQWLPTLRLLMPAGKIVALSARLDTPEAALYAGADLFISKSDPPEKVLRLLALL